jgi:hypothetical protein
MFALIDEYIDANFLHPSTFPLQSGGGPYIKEIETCPSPIPQPDGFQFPKIPIHGQLAGLGLGSMFAEPCPAREWYYSDKTGPRSE